MRLAVTASILGPRSFIALALFALAMLSSFIPFFHALGPPSKLYLDLLGVEGDQLPSNVPLLTGVLSAILYETSAQDFLYTSVVLRSILCRNCLILFRNSFDIILVSLQIYQILARTCAPDNLCRLLLYSLLVFQNHISYLLVYRFCASRKTSHRLQSL